jgi:predicted ester cyclase
MIAGRLGGHLLSGSSGVSEGPVFPNAIMIRRHLEGENMYRTLLLILALGTLSAVSAQENASKAAETRGDETRNEEVIRQNLAALNHGDIDRYAQDFAEDAKNFDQPIGREGIRRGVADILATFPDWRFDIVELVAKGDTVVARLTASGTHRGVGKLPLNGGMLVGIAPTLKHFSVQHIHWYKLRDGKILEHTATRNDIGMMRQLGLLPPTGLPK